MRVIDAGHEYSLDSLDGEMVNILTFVKREGDKYPGNAGHHPGTTMQEVLRALIERAEYVYNQTPCLETYQCIQMWKRSIILLEERAAKRHGRSIATIPTEDIIIGVCKCPSCGHVGCIGDCHDECDTACDNEDQ